MSEFVEYPKVIHIGAQKITVKSAAEEAKWRSSGASAKPVTQAAPIRPVHANVDGDPEPVVPEPKPEPKPKPTKPTK